MGSFSRPLLFCSLVLVLSSNAIEVMAATRAPSSHSEKSLLYWRYLCRNQPQTDQVRNGVRELSCPVQGWKVRASLEDARVKEVSEDER